MRHSRISRVAAQAPRLLLQLAATRRRRRLAGVDRGCARAQLRRGALSRLRHAQLPDQHRRHDQVER